MQIMSDRDRSGKVKIHTPWHYCFIFKVLSNGQVRRIGEDVTDIFLVREASSRAKGSPLSFLS